MKINRISFLFLLIGFILIQLEVTAQKHKIKIIEEIKTHQGIKTSTNAGDTVSDSKTFFNIAGQDSIRKEFKQQELISKTVYYYDLKQRLIEESEFVFDQDEDSVYSYKYFYNDFDTLILEILLTDGNIDGFFEYQYFPEQTIKKKVYYSGELRLNHNDTILFDTNGRVIKEVCSAWNYMTEYNELHLKKKERFWTENSSSFWSYKYLEFDLNNNWVEKAIYLDNNLKYQVNRRIEYY